MDENKSKSKSAKDCFPNQWCPDLDDKVGGPGSMIPTPKSEKNERKKD